MPSSREFFLRNDQTFGPIAGAVRKSECVCVRACVRVFIQILKKKREKVLLFYETDHKHLSAKV